MSKIRQILRMYSQGRSKLSIAEQTGVSRNTAKKYMATYDASGLTFEQINSLNDKELDDFFGTIKEPPSQDRLLALQRCFPHRTGEQVLWHVSMPLKAALKPDRPIIIHQMSF